MNKWLIRFVRSKTMIFALGLTVLSTLQASMGVFTAFLSPTAYGLLGMVVGVVVAVLRYITTMPIKDK